MPNIASVLKSEIARVARKELRAAMLDLKKSASAHRAEIAALKRRTQELEQQLRRLSKTAAKTTPPAETETAPVVRRFSARSLASQRKRLGLSARDLGLLIGVSTQSIYNWEEGKARPHAKHLSAIGALRTLGKRAVKTHLESLQGAG